MTTKYISAIVLLSFFIFTSCRDDHTVREPEIGIIGRVSFAMGAPTSVAEVPENQIFDIDVYCFRKKNGESDYTFEKSYLNLVLEANNQIEMDLDGSLERIIYFTANNESDISFIPTLSTLTAQGFEELMALRDAEVPQMPYTLVAKQKIPATLAIEPIAVNLEHILACLDINNQYAGFDIDSLVLKGAVCGSTLFSSDISLSIPLSRADINYGKTQQLFLYETDASVLAVYGKYMGVRAVFDIRLKEIKRATKYRVTFRSINDSSVDFTSNLAWNVTEWKSGSTIESTPDWNH